MHSSVYIVAHLPGTIFHILTLFLLPKVADSVSVVTYPPESLQCIHLLLRNSEWRSGEHGLPFILSLEVCLISFILQWRWSWGPRSGADPSTLQ